MAANKEPAWRNTPMSGTASADPTADGITWHAVAVDDVVKRLATDTGRGLEAEKLIIRSSGSLRSAVTAVKAGA